MFGNHIDLKDYRLIAVRKDKEISSIEYIDGTVDLNVDLPNDVIAKIYEHAAEHNIEAEEAATQLIAKGLEEYIDREEKE